VFSSNTVTPASARPAVTLTRAGSLVVTVTDSGAGISKDNQLHLFREGVQFNANQLQAGQGSGLGLWISYGECHANFSRLTAIFQS
jgi:signal transduction histidine kinase